MGESPVVLVVEPHATTRRLVSEVLRGEGYAPLPAADGQDALELLTTQRPELVIAELQLEGLNAVQLNDARRGDEALASIPFLLATTLPARSVEHLVSEFDGVIHKPFAVDALVAHVRRLCPIAPPRRGSSRAPLARAARAARVKR